METIQSNEKIKELDKIYQKNTEVNNELLQHWLDNTLFHWDFFLSLLLTILPIILWVKYHNKNNTISLLFVGFFVSFVATNLDYFGVQYGKWYYTGKLIPFFTGLLPWDWSILPIFVMALIQFKPNMSPIVKGLIFAFGSAFIGEPIFLWIGLYVIKDWNLFYSFLIYFVIYLAAHMVSKIINTELK